MAGVLVQLAVASNATTGVVKYEVLDAITTAQRNLHQQTALRLRFFKVSSVWVSRLTHVSVRHACGGWREHAAGLGMSLARDVKRASKGSPVKVRQRSRQRKTGAGEGVGREGGCNDRVLGFRV